MNMPNKSSLFRRVTLKSWLIRFLVLALLVGQPVYGEGGLSGVDLSRIKISSGKEPVVVEMGELQFRGSLSQNVPFNQKEINDLVKKALEMSEMSQLELIEAQRMVQKASEAAKFTKDDEERIRQNLIKTMGVVPEAGAVTAIIKVIDTYTKTKSWDDVGAASATLLEQSSADWVKDTAFGMVNEMGELGESINQTNKWMGTISSITDFCSMMMDEYDRNYMKWKAIADGANAKRQINKFYSNVMDLIEAYKYKSIEGGWTLIFDNASDGRSFKFFGSPSNFQTWELTMELKQETKNKEGSAAGVYSGQYFLNAEHDLSGFLRFREPDAIISSLPTLNNAYQGLKSSGFKVKLSGSHNGYGYLGRSISGSATATIDPNGTMDIQLQPASDEIQVNISGLKIAMKIDAFTAVVKSGGIFEFELKADREDMGIVSGMANLSVIAPEFAQNSKQQGKGFTSQGWDTTLWKPLEKQPVLKHD